MKQSDIEEIGLVCAYRIAFYTHMSQNKELECSDTRELADWAAKDLKQIFNKILATAGPRVNKRLNTALAGAAIWIATEWEKHKEKDE